VHGSSWQCKGGFEPCIHGCAWNMPKGALIPSQGYKLQLPAGELQG
jgi:hypothetical protein